MNKQVTIKWEEIKAGQTFGDAWGENEYTVISKEYCRLRRRSIVWVRDLDGETMGFSVEQINDTIRFDNWDKIGGFYNK